jgi:hypothetical protein
MNRFIVRGVYSIGDIGQRRGWPFCIHGDAIAVVMGIEELNKKYGEVTVMELLEIADEPG